VAAGGSWISAEPTGWCGTMNKPTAASAAVAGTSSGSTSRTYAGGDADHPDQSLDEPMKRRSCQQPDLDIVEDIIEGFSIASFTSLEDLEVCIRIL